MKLNVLYAQRKQQHPGEYMPEALEVVDDFIVEENPDILDELRTKYLDTGVFARVEWFVVNLPHEALSRIVSTLSGHTDLGTATLEPGAAK